MAIHFPSKESSPVDSPGTFWFFLCCSFSEDKVAMLVVPWLVKQEDARVNKDAMVMIKIANEKFMKKQSEDEPFDAVHPMYKKHATAEG